MDEGMKKRMSFVSNSSSSSFVVLNWSELSDEKRKMILEYQKFAINEWNRLGISIVDEENYGIHPVYRKSSDEYDENDGKIDIDSEYDFGIIDDCVWKFEIENGILKMSTCMDNFSMEAWMNHIGGIEYRWNRT